MRTTDNHIVRHVFGYGYREDFLHHLPNDWFSKTCSNKTKGNGFKVKEGRFILDIRKKFFYGGGGETLEHEML